MFDTLLIDYITSYNETKDGKYLLCCMDTFSKFVFLFPTNSMDANTVADIIVNQIFYEYNFFKNLASDLGSNFMSKLTLAICEMFGMRKVSSS